MRILLIEDNRDHAELIQRSLDSGFPQVRVQLTPNAKEAYQLLKKQRFNLILSDYYLPDAKGEAHIRELNRRAPDVPIVVITGQGDEKVAARSIKAGAEDYVVKTREVLAALPKILRRAIVKHHSHQNKRKRELQRQMLHQKQKVKKVLGEMAEINRNVKILKKQNTAPASLRGKRRKNPPLENLLDRLDSLKKFVRKVFLSRESR